MWLCQILQSDLFRPPNATQVFQHSRTPWGFVVGAGTEWSFAPNWSLVSEFLYMGFERNSQSFACGSVATCGGDPVGTQSRFDFTDSIWVARIGVNYRFAPGVVRF